MADIAASPHSIVNRCRFYGRLVRDSTLSASAKNVAWLILEHVNTRTGLCYPSEERLARALQVNVKTVERAVKQLTEAGWFCISPHGRGNHYEPIYYHRMDLAAESVGGSLIQPGSDPDKNVGSRPSEHPTNLSTKADSIVPGNPTYLSDKPVDQTLKEPGRAGLRAASGADLASRPPPSPDAIWKKALETLKDELSVPEYKAWVECLAPLRFEADGFVFAVSSRFQRDQVSEIVLVKLENILGKPVFIEINPLAVKRYQAKLN
jgi:hypothetical protein